MLGDLLYEGHSLCVLFFAAKSCSIWSIGVGRNTGPLFLLCRVVLRQY